MNLIVVDLGGTHARFTLAKRLENQIEILQEPIIASTKNHDSLRSAWFKVRESLLGMEAQPRQNKAVIAVASPINEDLITLTNHSWQFKQSSLTTDLELESCTVINDFAAVAHAIPHLKPHELLPIDLKPPTAIDQTTHVTIIGMGTGIGVAHRHQGQVIATEGGHTGFAPRNDREDRLLARLRDHFGRLSIERLVSGMGLSHLIAELNRGDYSPKTHPLEFTPEQNRLDWDHALNRKTEVAIQALDWYCELAGTYVGDIALASGAKTILIGGGLGLRLQTILPQSQFMACFNAKGRMTRLMEQISVQVITHPQPGLLGAAAVGLEV
ncbi:MAG: glucokinase [Candidatus Pacebacteria bacterium]|nr:glucokinase [Candidatus Paceibacterota bacterium]